MVHAEASLNRKYVELLKLLNVYLNHFPKHERYALSNRIRNTAYAVYEYIVEGQKRYHKKTTLTNLDIKHEQLRMQLLLAFELGYFRYRDERQAEKSPGALERHRYSAISLQVDEIGRMIGGWIKSEMDTK